MTQNLLTEQSKAAIEQWCARYPKEQRKSGLLQSLMIAQEQNGGYLSKELIADVADYLGVERIAAYEVATFYSLYDLEPTLKHKIYICTNISCMLRGSDEIVQYLKEKVKNQCTLKEVECLGACVNAPVMQIGKDYHENLTKEKIDAILAELK